jgi:hypothetical protein
MIRLRNVFISRSHFLPLSTAAAGEEVCDATTTQLNAVSGGQERKYPGSMWRSTAGIRGCRF